MDSIDEKIVKLRDEDGLPWSKISEIVRMPKGTAHSRYVKAKSDIRPEPKGKVEDETRGNVRKLDSRLPQIQTLEELIEWCRVDLDVWDITKHIVNYWGNAENPNTQVKAWLAKKNPEPINPVISPVSVKIRMPKLPKAKRPPNLKRAVFIQDAQIGFTKSLRTGDLRPLHDRAAMDVALQITQDIKPDVVVAGGDWLDLADWSDKYARTPNMYWTTQPAVLEAAWWLGQFRAHTDKMYKIEGNHEERMPRQIIEHLKEAFGLRSVDNMTLPPLMSIPRLLALHELDIEWVGDYPDGEVWLSKYLRAEHGSVSRAKSGATVSHLLVDAQVTTVIGHVHRIELAYKTVWDADGARDVAVFCPGCLCRVDGVVPGVKARQNWKQGLGVVDYTDNEVVGIYPIPINQGVAYFEGKKYEARDRLEELREATKDPKDGRPWPY